MTDKPPGGGMNLNNISDLYKRIWGTQLGPEEKKKQIEAIENNPEFIRLDNLDKQGLLAQPILVKKLRQWKEAIERLTMNLKP